LGQILGKWSTQKNIIRYDKLSGVISTSISDTQELSGIITTSVCIDVVRIPDNFCTKYLH